MSGIYREVVPDEKLLFTWAWRTMPEREPLVTVALKSDGGGTLLTLTREQLFDEGARDRDRPGGGAPDRLEQYLTAGGTHNGNGKCNKA